MASAEIGGLPGLSLFLCEQAIHVPRGLDANFLGQMSRISRSVLRSTLRYLSSEARCRK